MAATVGSKGVKNPEAKIRIRTLFIFPRIMTEASWFSTGPFKRVKIPTTEQMPPSTMATSVASKMVEGF